MIVGKESLYKIGLSKNMKKRLEAYKTHNPFPTKLIHTIQTNESSTLEGLFHILFKKKNVDYKIEKGTSIREWFSLLPEDVLFFKSFTDEINFKKETDMGILINRMFIRYYDFGGDKERRVFDIPYFKDMKRRIDKI